MTFIDVFLTVTAIGVVLIAFGGVWANWKSGRFGIEDLPELTNSRKPREW